MEKFALDGLWLAAALAVVYFVGVFTSQYVKDKMAGVPSELRAALRVAESDAKSQLSAAKAKAVSDVTGLFKQAVNAAPVTLKAVIVDPPAAPAAPAAAPAAPAAPEAPAASAPLGAPTA